MSVKRGAPAPAVVGSHFVKQYYGEVLSKKPVELHRFYKDESTFCHASGTKEEEPVSGLADIKAKIEHLGLGGATVDLGCGSVDAQPSEGDGVLLMVTGSITITDQDPRQFVQTFFLARQYQDNDRHNYFVRNDIFRFLDVLPEVVEGAVRMREEDGSAPRAAPDLAESTAEAVEPESPQQRQLEVDSSASSAGILQASSPAITPAAPPAAISPMLASQAVAPASEPQPVAIASTAAAASAPSGSAPDNGGSTKTPAVKVGGAPSSSPAVSATTGGAPPASSLPPPAVSASPSAFTPAQSAPPAPMTYASLAKSWATVAAVGGEAAAPSLGAAGGAPASSSSSSGVVGGVSGNGAPAGGMGNGSWEMVNSGGSGSGVGESVMSGSHGGQPGGGSGGGGVSNARPPSSQSNKGPKGQYGNIPHHASPAVAASAAAAREAAAAGNGEILPATSLFVRKVDMTIDRDDMIAHFGAYGEVTGISMNPTRGYAFIDYRNNDCVALALSTKEHYVNRKLLVVEERHSPMLGRNPRGEHGGGRGGRNGGRGRGSGGRDVRDGERGDRRPPGGRGGRNSIGRADRPDGSGPKDGGYKARARAEQT